MATTVRGSSGGREKRGTSPSGSLIKKSPKPSTSTPTSSCSSPTDDKAASPTDGKPVPNYLKPTISSSLDFSRLPKKSSTDSSAQKPALNRRRSFDRPPPSSQVQKAIRGPSAVREIKPIRSSSFSHKSAAPSGSSTRPASEKSFGRSASGVKDSKVEPLLSKSRSLKKSTLSSTTATTTTKKEQNGAPSSSSKKKAPKSVTSESSLDYDNPSVDQLAVEDDLVNIDHEVLSLPEMSEMPGSNKELGDPTITEDELKHVEDVQDSTLQEDHQHEHEGKSPAADQVAEEAAVQDGFPSDLHLDEKEEQYSTETKPEQEAVEVSAVNQTEVNAEVKGEEQNTTGEDAGEENEADKKALEVEPAETLAEQKNEEEESLEQEAEKVEEETEAKDDKQSVNSPPAASAPAPTPAAAPAKAQSAAGKKDKQVYNDVIEETSKKLMGGKKNKVLALAGAFETVISLQDTNNN